MGRHANLPEHQSGHNRATVAALRGRDLDATQPMTVVADEPATEPGAGSAVTR